MKTLIENMDLFAHKINFNYRKKSLYHSYFGFSLSLAAYGTMIFFVWYFSKDFVNSSNPKVIYKETEFENNITVKLEDILNPQFYFSFEITKKELPEEIPDTSSQTIPSEQFGEFFIAQKRKFKIPKIIFFNYSVSSEYYPVKSRSEEIHHKYVFYNKLDSNSTYLLEDENPDILEINDHDLKVKKIINITETNFTLLSGDIILFGFQVKSGISDFLYSKNTSSMMKFLFYKKDNIINANSEEFFKTYETTQISIADVYEASGTESRQYLKSNPQNANYGVVCLNDDRGFIMSNEKKEYNLKKNYDSVQTISNENVIYLYQIDISTVMKQYDRIYKKLQNVFADLGGIIKSLILIGNIIIVHFNQKKFDYDLINNVFKSEKNINEKIEMKANLGNLGLNLIEMSKNLLSKVEMNSSRNLLKKSIIDETTNKNNCAEQAEESKVEMNPYPDVYSNNNPMNRKANSSTKHQKIETFDKSLEIKEKENVLKDQQLFNDKKEKEKIEKECQNPSTNIDLFIDNYESGALFRKPLKYSKNDFLKSFLCCARLKGDDLVVKENIFSMAKNKIDQYMDVLNLINLYEKIEKLISIVFNEQQAKSFNFILNRQINEIETENIDRDFIKKIIDYYKENIKESKMSLIDERIIKSIYPSFSKLIESDL